MTRLRLALLGAGAMGRKHAKAVLASSDAVLTVVIDRDPERARLVADAVGAQPSIDPLDSLTTDGAIIATPTAMHAVMALPLVEAGLPVFVEKPLAEDLADVGRLLDTSRDRGTVLMCGLVERFNPALSLLRTVPITSDSHIVTTRFGPPPARSHGGVVDDLLVHDLDLVLRLVGPTPVVNLTIESCHWNPSETQPESIEVHLDFALGCRATLRASRLADRVTRSTSITGRNAATLHVNLMNAHSSGHDSLTSQLQHFVRLVRSGKEDELERERASIWPSHYLMDQITCALRTSSCSR